MVSVDGTAITVRPALQWNHPGASVGSGASPLRPHVGNLSRNVVIASERAAGTRGHMMFLERADVDLRYVEVRDMGRTMTGAIDSTTFDDQGRALRVGTNQIGRYAIHFHHNFGPAAPPRNGHQFTLVGNVVSSLNGVLVRPDRVVVNDREITLEGNVRMTLPAPK